MSDGRRERVSELSFDEYSFNPPPLFLCQEIQTSHMTLPEIVDARQLLLQSLGLKIA